MKVLRGIRQLSEVTMLKGMWNSKGLSRLKRGTVRAAGVVRESNQNSVLPGQLCISRIISSTLRS